MLERLIEGAAEGAKGGHSLLKHLETLPHPVHLIDIDPIDSTDPGRKRIVSWKKMQ